MEIGFIENGRGRLGKINLSAHGSDFVLCYLSRRFSIHWRNPWHEGGYHLMRAGFFYVIVLLLAHIVVIWGDHFLRYTRTDRPLGPWSIIVGDAGSAVNGHLKTARLYWNGESRLVEWR